MWTILLALAPALLPTNARPVPASFLSQHALAGPERPSAAQTHVHTLYSRQLHQGQLGNIAAPESQDPDYEVSGSSFGTVADPKEAALSDNGQAQGTIILVPPQAAPAVVGVADAPPPSNSSSAPAPIIAAYYPDWGADTVSPEQVDFDRFDWLDFAFAVPNADFDLEFDSPQSTLLLARLVTAAHAKNKFVKLSIGGWTGSAHFSDAVANETNRATFVAKLSQIYTQYNLDGIDIDWEYPGVMGETGNSVSPQDTNNFLIFLHALRAELPASARITAACQVWPFADEAGNPQTDVSAFASVLDWILIMNYDTWGSSSTPGPNAPLDDGCHNSSQPFANARTAVASWTRAGFPASQIILGIPAYGYINSSPATSLHSKRAGEDRGQAAFEQHSYNAEAGQPKTSTSQAEETVQDISAMAAPLKVENDDGSTTGGQVQFRNLVHQGALKLSPSGKYVGAHGFKRFWDHCSSTPFLRSQNAKQVVTYDDPESLELKAAFAKEAGLLGVNMFDVHGDTERWELIDAARAGLGLTM